MAIAPGNGRVPAPGTRSSRAQQPCARLDPVPAMAGWRPERPREIGAGALRSRPLRLRLRRSRPAPTTRGSPGGWASTPVWDQKDARRSVPAALALPAGPPACLARSRARSRRCAALRRSLRAFAWDFRRSESVSFRVQFVFCEGPRLWSGLGSVGVGGPPRVDPCDALLRPVLRRVQAGLAGAHAAPAPALGE